MKLVLNMHFLILSNIKIRFAQKKLDLRAYIAVEALSTTKRIKIINKKEFARAILDKNIKVFIIYIISLLTIAIYLAKKD